MDATSSSSTLISSLAARMLGPKTVLGTNMKLNGSNYLLWAQAFRIFIGAQNKLGHLLAPPPATTDTTYERDDLAPQQSGGEAMIVLLELILMKT